LFIDDVELFFALLRFGAIPGKTITCLEITVSNHRSAYCHHQAHQTNIQVLQSGCMPHKILGYVDPFP